MNWLYVLSGPLIGAVIGYCTNYVAVKMLFRPLTPKYLGQWRLPFTPGIIPKRKDELARSIGATIEKHLLTGDDIRDTLLSEGMKKTVSGAAVAALTNREKTLDAAFSSRLGEDAWESGKEKLCGQVLMRAKEGILRIDVPKLIVEKGSEAVKNAVAGKLMASLFINDAIIALYGEKVEAGIRTYLEENLEDLLRPVIRSELNAMTEKTFGETADSLQMEDELLQRAVAGVYEKLVREKAETAVSQVGIAGIVQRKLDAMSARELEELVFSVMKHELQAIVNLGALIGFVIGLLNLLF